MITTEWYFSFWKRHNVISRLIYFSNFIISFFYNWIKFHYVYGPHFHYPFFFLSGHQGCFHLLAVMPLIYLLPLECNFQKKKKYNFITSLYQHMLDAKQLFFWMQMNGFSVSVIAESGSYDEVKQALILKEKKIFARGHTIYFTWISQKCLWDVICSHLVLWQKTKVRHMMSKTAKDVPAFWLFRLLPSLMLPRNVNKPSEKNFAYTFVI